MGLFFEPTPDERRALEELAGEIPEIQQTLIRNSDQLTAPDRGAHQQQLAGGRVVLQVERVLPPELHGLGVFAPASAPAGGFTGIGRISTGLGCPHAKTAPDFLGLMLAFMSPAGKRIDFVTINDPTAPTNTPGEFIALLKATADSARTGSQAVLLLSLARHAGLRAAAIATHVIGQTARTTRSSTAYQPVLDRGGAGERDARQVRVRADRGRQHAARSGAGSAVSDPRLARASAGGSAHLRPVLDSVRRRRADADREVDAAVGAGPPREGRPCHVPAYRSRFTRGDARSAPRVGDGREPGNWFEEPDRHGADILPATEYTAARALAYRRSQQERQALPDESIVSFFTTGAISPELADELLRRQRQKQSIAHWTP